jgi:ubiquinone/menaquinone biosynthesis C-methylase UbiE
MLAEAALRGRRTLAALLIADVTRLPLATATIDAIFAAGLLPHLPNSGAGLTELARVTRALRPCG